MDNAISSRSRAHRAAGQTDAEREAEVSRQHARRVRQRAAPPPSPFRPIETFDEQAVQLLAYKEMMNLGAMVLMCTLCHAQFWLPEKVSKSPNLHPRFHGCCSAGKVLLPPLPNPPEELRNLLDNQQTREARKFRQHIRKYNSGLSFASVAATQRSFAHAGVPVFTISGIIHRRVGPLHPQTPVQRMPEAVRSCLQTYFYDLDEQAELRGRMAGIPARDSIDAPTLLSLQTMIHRVNPYIAALQNCVVEAQNAEHYVIQINSDAVPAGMHAGRFNAPAAGISEVALLQGGDTQSSPRSILIHNRHDGPLQEVSILHQCYDAWAYPLFFPLGTHGYSLGLTQHTPPPAGQLPKKLSMNQFYAFRFQYRPQYEYSTILRGRLLLHQYVVDMWEKIESNRLQYIRQNQKNIRTEHRDVLVAAVRDNQETNVGRDTVLPESVTGSPRDLNGRYLDSMAIVARFGRPDIFITFTSNPHWREITEALLPGQTWGDRPDIVARVFQLKKTLFLKLILELNVLGEWDGYTISDEFQKRGLPHFHFLLILKPSSKPRTPADLDNLIWAEIPDATVHPQLYEMVMRHMGHTPCGVGNPTAPCMRDGINCHSKYPKSFVEVSTLSETSDFGHYRYILYPSPLYQNPKSLKP